MRGIVLRPEKLSEEAMKLFCGEYQQLSGRTDRLIACIMALQWAGAIIASLVIYGGYRYPSTADHPEFTAACILGGLLTMYPVYLAIVIPGEQTTRHLIAGCQMLMSGLLIYISGGRIETHFHVFGSLALLSLYLDWEVLITATTALFVNHSLMGYFMPRSLFNAPTVASSRVIEYVFWVVVFNIVLIIACVQSQRRLKVVAKREAEQVHQGYHDVLTGLGNRLLLERHMNEAAEARQSYIFMTLDLDKFKEVNDTLGHNIGDKVLSKASKRMKAEIRDIDHLIRIGGDEFALIVSQCADVTVAGQIAERIIDALNQPFQCGGHSISIGVSIGICQNPDASITSAEILRNADMVLYRVKKAGRNRYLFFGEDQKVETLHDMSLEHRLRSAVRNDALHLHYQPIVNTNGILLGFEALLRWNDAIHGSVPPSEFIPVAERSGLIVPLGAWVLRTACAQAAEWRKAGHKPVKMAVNVSSIQLLNEDFVPTVLGALKDTGLPADMLDLELTESTLIENYGETIGALELLHQHGVQLSIDDFGTGYSSLSYLRDLPVHTLKIDRAFVKDIALSVEARLLIESMITMAHALKLRVVAEGVESRDQLKILTLAGCDEIQGFHFSRAVPSEGAKQFMRCADSGMRQTPQQTKVHEMPMEALGIA